MVVDLHNHTPLCNHAQGELKEYVERAIQEKIELFGFSDHAPMNFDKKYRMSLEDCDRYEQEVKALKREYQNSLEIVVAYEVDFLPPLLERRVLEANVDYLIGSIHFLPDKMGLWGFDNPQFLNRWEEVEVDEVYKLYFQMVEEMAKTNLFQIVGHLDLVKVFNHRPKTPIQDLALNALKAIKKANMAVEINSAGLRKQVKELYPSKELLEMIGEMEIPITFGSDAHSPQDVGKGLKEARKVAKELGFQEVAIFKNKQLELIKL